MKLDKNGSVFEKTVPISEDSAKDAILYKVRRRRTCCPFRAHMAAHAQMAPPLH